MLKPFIEALGKPPALSKTLSEMSGQTISANAIHQWPRDGKIPDRWHPYLVTLARRDHIPLPPELEAVARLMPSEAKAS